MVYVIQIHTHADRENNEKAICLAGETNERNKGVFVGVEEYDYNSQSKTEDDGLGDIWKEMSVALECTKVLISGLHGVLMK